jgi:NAD(P)-dependent dehydrogenase (short-subunit alcohol dehydrogenase family)
MPCFVARQDKYSRLHKTKENTMKLAGKTALITGATTGIGFATAKKFLGEGANLIITGQDRERLDAAKRELGAEVLAIQLDVRNHDQFRAMHDAIAHAGRRIDVLFANAGVAFATPIANTSVERYDELMNINVKGVFFTIQSALPLLNDGGSIILNTSWLNEVGTAGLSVLSASKATVRSFVRTLSAELLPRKIRVNAVSPGAMATPLHAKIGMSPAELEKFAAQLTQRIPLGHFGAAEDIAAAALFLASDESSYMLGSEIVVDGGFSQL